MKWLSPLDFGDFKFKDQINKTVKFSYEFLVYQWFIMHQTFGLIAEQHIFIYTMISKVFAYCHNRSIVTFTAILSPNTALLQLALHADIHVYITDF